MYRIDFNYSDPQGEEFNLEATWETLDDYIEVLELHDERGNDVSVVFESEWESVTEQVAEAIKQKQEDYREC